VAKREKTDRSPGRQGGATYVRRDAEGKFTDDQSEIGKSVSTDRRIDTEHEAPKGQKDRGD
jgi:hypothetical protein